MRLSRFFACLSLLLLAACGEATVRSDVSEWWYDESQDPIPPWSSAGNSGYSPDQPGRGSVVADPTTSATQENSIFSSGKR